MTKSEFLKLKEETFLKEDYFALIDQRTKEHLDILESKMEQSISFSEHDSYLADVAFLTGYARCYCDLYEDEHTICLPDAFDVVDKVIAHYYPNMFDD